MAPGLCLGAGQEVFTGTTFGGVVRCGYDMASSLSPFGGMWGVVSVSVFNSSLPSPLSSTCLLSPHHVRVTQVRPGLLGTYLPERERTMSRDKPHSSRQWLMLWWQQDTERVRGAPQRPGVQGLYPVACPGQVSRLSLGWAWSVWRQSLPAFSFILPVPEEPDLSWGRVCVLSQVRGPLKIVTPTWPWESWDLGTPTPPPQTAGSQVGVCEHSPLLGGCPGWRGRVHADPQALQGLGTTCLSWSSAQLWSLLHSMVSQLLLFGCF